MRDHPPVTPVGYVTLCLWPDGEWTASEGLAPNIDAAADAAHEHLRLLSTDPDDPADHVRVFLIPGGAEVTEQALVVIAARMIARADSRSDAWLAAPWRPYMQRASEDQIAAVKQAHAARQQALADRRAA